MKSNPRQITKSQLDKLRETMGDMGDLSGITYSLDEARYITGNQRMAVIGMGAKPITEKEFDAPLPDGTAARGYFEYQGSRFEYRAIRGWSTKKCEAAMLIANHAGGSDDWDELSGWGADVLKSCGFDEDALKVLSRDFGGLTNLLESEQEEPKDAPPQVDRAAELQEKWQVKRGDLWQIGEHRLLCGDSTVRADVERVMGGEKAGVVIADAPYGMKLDTDYSGMTSAKSFGRGHTHEKVIGDEKPFDASAVCGCDCKEQFWFGADYYAKSLGDTEQSGSWLVWDKRITDSAGLMYGSCFELIFSKQKHKRDILRHLWAGFFTGGEERTFDHPTEKPVSLIIDLINLCKDAMIIYDPFCGCGPSLAACQNLSRKCRAIEISENYCAVILDRCATAFPGIEITRLD